MKLLILILQDEIIQATICCIGCMWIYGEGKSPLVSLVHLIIGG